MIPTIQKMIPTIQKCFFMLLLLMTTSEASAGWVGCRIFSGEDCVDYEIGDIFDDINGLTPNTFMNDFRNQRENWRPFKGKALLVPDAIKDILQNLPAVRLEFLKFIGTDNVTSSEKCHIDSECGIFRDDLTELFKELNGLKTKFPAFEKAGLVDSSIAEAAIHATPPFILFGMYKVLSRQPQWKDVPFVLSDIFDELDDPDIFSLNLADDNSEAEDVSLFANTSASVIPAVSDSTKTQRFCARRADKFDGVGRGLNGNRDGWDQIRVNRIILVVTLYTDIWKFALDLVPDDFNIGVSLLGEGGAIGIPSSFFTFFFKAVPLALESILKAIDVYHQNIGLCKDRFSEIESRLASCGYFTEFVLDRTAQDEYYQLVKRRFEMADEAGITHTQSTNLFDKSKVKLENGLYSQAFTVLCDSYSSIGISR